MHRDEVRPHLQGPIASLKTPFARDGQVDYEGLRRQIDATIANGSRTALLTAGDSHYLCLSEEEIGQVTRTTCQQVAGRALVVAADRWYDTARAVAFARFAREGGADVLMVLPPDWGPSITIDTLLAHCRAVSAELPVMLVTGLFSARGADFGLRAIDRILDECPAVVAIKDDMCGDFARRLCLLAHERVALFAGGRKENHMNMWPYGCDGYMSTFLATRPQVAHAYWQAVQSKDLGAARDAIRRDMAFFDFIQTFTGGWNAAYHGVLELAGLSGRWRRPPYYSLSDAEMEKLADFLEDQGLSPSI